MSDHLLALFYTVVFPPYVPQTQEEDEQGAQQDALLQLWKEAVHTFHGLTGEELSPLLSCTDATVDIHRDGRLSAEALTCVLSGLRPRGACIVWVNSSNCGILIHRDTLKTVTFAMYESAAPNEVVMAAAAPLNRSFPGTSVRSSWKLWDMSRWKKFCATLADLSRNPVREFIPTIVKAGKECPEIRDTPHPGAVTQVLATMLLSLGVHQTPARFHKRVYDEVCWDDTKLPWRRLPLWLALRVGMQSLLIHGDDLAKGPGIYKNIQVVVVALVCQRLHSAMGDDARTYTEPLDLARSKLVRRMGKLHQRGLLHDKVDTFASNILRSMQRTMRDEWRRTQTQMSRDVLPQALTFQEKYTELYLRKSSTYLESRLERRPDVSRVSPDVPSQPCATRCSNSSPDDLLSNLNTEKTERDQAIALEDLEKVASSLGYAESAKSVLTLQKLFKQYGQSAATLYMISEHGRARNADRASIRMLTLAELWMHLDRLTVSLMPSVSRLSPGFPSQFFRRLRLSSRFQMERIAVIEDYMRERATPKSPFTDADMHQFAESHYDNDRDMQEVHAALDAEVACTRAEQEEEWESRRTNVAEWQREAKSTAHTYVRNRWGHSVCADNCPCCRLENLIKNEQIEVYEEPLPPSRSMAKWVIFEARCPNVFRAWREVTWALLTDEGRPRRQTSLKIHTQLESYYQLNKTCLYTNSRITLASSVKSFEASHYGRYRPVAESTWSDVYQPNALKYFLYDGTLGTAMDGDHPEVPELFFRYPGLLPEAGMYASMDAAIRDTCHTSNEVMSRMDQCPSEMSPYEFEAFWHMRCGESLQWLNILQALATPSLNMTALPSEWLITQAALELGTRETTQDWRRKSHAWFADDEFCAKLSSPLRERIASIRANWKELSHMRLLLALICRMESLTGSKDCQNQCQRLRMQIRSASVAWVKSIGQSLISLQVGADDRALRETQFQSALLCRATFCPTDDMIDWPSYWDSIFVIDTHAPALLKDAPALSAHLLLHDWSVAHQMEESARRSALRNPRHLNEAVARAWEKEVQLGHWTSLESPNERWLHTETIAGPADDRQSMAVHVNVLTGALLIDGLPQNQLPLDYRSTHLYRELFRGRQLQVRPTSVRGMRFVAKTADGDVFFGWGKGNIIIGRQDKDGVEELVPHNVFGPSRGDADLPFALLNGCIHWLCLSGACAGRIRIVPLARALKTHSPEDWNLLFHARAAARQGRRLLESASPFVTGMRGQLGTFEQSYHVIPWVDADGQVALELPRSGLVFHLHGDGRLCNRATNSIISLSRETGVFTGLSTVLVMEDCPASEKTLLIPYGDVRVAQSTSAHHPRVTIEVEDQTHMTIFRWQVNRLLHRLDHTAEPQALLFQAYLFAVTSGPLADSLTHRTGTAEAVALLQEARRQMYWPLSGSVEPLLQKLASLTPQRHHYPQHLHVMQQSHWSQALAVTSQSAVFGRLVNEIVRWSNALGKFHAGYQELTSPQRGPDTLVQRALHREARFARSTLISSWIQQTSPASYEGRDRLTDTPRLRRVFEMAKLTADWTLPTSELRNLGSCLNGAGDLAGFHKPWICNSISSLLSTDSRTQWGPLYQRCCHATQETHQNELLFVLPFMAFCKENRQDLLRALLAVACSSSLKDMPTYCGKYLDFWFRERPSREMLSTHIAASDVQPIPNVLEQRSYESDVDFCQREERHRQKHEDQLRNETTRAVEGLLRQWPVAGAMSPAGSFRRVRSGTFLGAIQPRWTRLWRNWELSVFLNDLMNSINALIQPRDMPIPSLREDVPSHAPTVDSPGPRWFWSNEPGLLKLLESSPRTRSLTKDLDRLSSSLAPSPYSAHTAPGTSSSSPCDSSAASTATPKSREDLVELDEIVSFSKQFREPIAAAFVDDLEASVDALRRRPLPQQSTPSTQETSHLPEPDEASRHAERILGNLRDCVLAHPSHGLLDLGDCVPPTSARDFLEILALPQFRNLQNSLQHSLVALAAWMVESQWARRLHLMAQLDQSSRVREELAERRHSWPLLDHPEWLLLELEMDVCIRANQYDMARSMIEPRSGQNSVFQLQMGAGKSSLIIPMIAATLADGKQLVRVIVTKPLLHPQGGVMRQRMGRLLRRRLLHVPFARSSPRDVEAMEHYRALHQDIRQDRGIVLALPEHLQSFQLCGIQCFLDGNNKAGRALVEMQEWLEHNARDVLDECDFILSTRTQLIYPSGSQSLVDGGARRWRIIGSLLRLLFDRAADETLRTIMALAVEEHQPGGFPFLHITTEEAEQELRTRLVTAMLSDNAFLPVSRRGVSVAGLRRALLADSLDARDWSDIESALGDDMGFKDLLILRGLLQQGILLLALAKRWNVEYGLHLERCAIAVPYLARGQPSPASEYGHPDVALTLTYLAYYHQGLTETQLRRAIEVLQFEEDPSLQWHQWVQHAHQLREELRAWNAVNVDDRTQLAQIHAAMSYSLPAIHFFLDVLVFPRAAREFDEKLVSSSWDLPLAPPRLTTGFSGTNDNAALLPASILADHLPQHRHTNAEVLKFLLEPRNRGYQCARGVADKALTVHTLLQIIANGRFDVILDVGALILEMSNAEVAGLWLSMRKDKDAVAFVASDGMLHVRYQDRRTETLTQSRFAGSLAGCLLYLDEAYCRGMDTRLAPDARAALTLGANQPKEKTVQAAMRMRRLGDQQAVTFIAPPLVDEDIRRCCQLPQGATVDSSHVLRWSIAQSVRLLVSLESLHGSQKRSFERRLEGTRRLRAADAKDANEEAVRITEPEKRSLRELYRREAPMHDVEQTQLPFETCEINKIRQNQRAVDDPEAIQERQVDHEVARQQQRQLPPPSKPCTHGLHNDISYFARDGLLKPTSRAYFSALGCTFSTTESSPFHPRDAVSSGSRLLISRDCFKTLHFPPSAQARGFPRPLRHLIWTSKQPEVLLAISPYEAEALVPILRKSTHAHLLLFEAPRTRNMTRHFHSATFFSVTASQSTVVVPPSLLAELHFFAGTTYFPYHAHEDLRLLLRTLNVEIDASDERRSDTDVGTRIVNFWRDWLNVRTHGSDTTHPAGLLIEDLPWKPNSSMFQSHDVAKHGHNRREMRRAVDSHHET